MAEVRCLVAEATQVASRSPCVRVSLAARHPVWDVCPSGRVRVTSTFAVLLDHGCVCACGRGQGVGVGGV